MTTLREYQLSRLPSTLASLLLLKRPRTRLARCARFCCLVMILWLSYVNVFWSWGEGWILALIGNSFHGLFLGVFWLGCWSDYRRDQKRARNCECVECGYSLVGNPDTLACPECGASAAGKAVSAPIESNER